MIGSLSGLPEIIDSNSIIIETGGVGYKVFCSSRTISLLPEGQVKLYIETHIREDQFSLYGFINKSELEWFKLLITVKGIGPKLALTILSHIEPNELAKSIRFANQKALSTISGLGPRTAERLIVELKGKIPDISEEDLKNLPESYDYVDDAISALITLGYNKNDINKVINNIIKSTDTVSNTKELIKLALRDLSK